MFNLILLDLREMVGDEIRSSCRLADIKLCN